MAPAGLVALVVIGVPGCASDRSADAGRIRAALPLMPGVEASHVDYINDFENGANLDIGLGMPHATNDQIRAAVESINDLTGSRFGRHRRSTAIGVANSTEVEYGGYDGVLDAGHVSTDVMAVRGLRARATAATIRWQHFDDYSSLELSESPNPDADLRAAITALPDSSTHLDVGSDAPDRQGSWDVVLPLTLKQADDAVGIRDRLPVFVYQTDMRDGRIGGLSVDLGDSATAAWQLAAVVSAVAPSQAHPLALEWRLAAGAPGEISHFTACSAASTASTIAPAEPSFNSLKEWAARAFPACAP